MNLRVAEGEVRYSPGETLKTSCLDLSSQESRGAGLKNGGMLSKHSQSAAMTQG